MKIIEEGGALPAIDLATPTGDRLNLRDYVGKIFVLYFYPKDDTSGCTPGFVTGAAIWLEPASV